MVIQDEWKKPETILYYDYMKGGVDIVDLLSTMASIKVKTKPWSNIVVLLILDTARTYGRTFFSEYSRKSLFNHEFTGRLGKALVIRFINQYYANSFVLHISFIYRFTVYSLCSNRIKSRKWEKWRGNEYLLFMQRENTWRIIRKEGQSPQQ